MHCPPFLQGLCLHSLTSEEGGRFLWFKCFIHFCINCGVFGTKQRSGGRFFKPAVTLCLRRTQRLAGNHSLWSQSWPSHPSGQTHWNEFTLSTQVPPFLHGLPMQSLISKIKRKWYDVYNDILKGLKEKKKKQPKNELQTTQHLQNLKAQVSTYSRDSRCHWNPDHRRRWSFRLAGWCSVLVRHRHWRVCSVCHPSHWLQQQCCSCQ